MTKPFSVLHISDTHLTSAYPGENLNKQRLAQWRTRTFVRRHCGLGNGSCGRNQTMDKYRFKATPEHWTLKIEPVSW